MTDPTAAELARLARRGRGRAFDRYEDELTDAIERILVRAGDQAANRFRRKAGSMVAAAPTSRSGMVAVYPAPEEAAILAQPNGEPADILHVTLAFLGDDVDPDTEEQVLGIVREVASEHGRLEGTVGGVASFGSENAEEPLYPSILLPDVVGLAELRQAVTDALDAAGIPYATNHGWTPHLTLSYTSEPSPPPARLIGQPLTFDALTVAVGDRPRDVELGRSLVAAPTSLSEADLREAGVDPAMIEAALTAAAEAGLVKTYDLVQGSQAGRTFEEASLALGYREASSASWPSEATLEDPAGDVLYRDETSGVFRLPGGTLIYVAIHGGWFQIRVSAPSRVEAKQTITAFSSAYPPMYRQEEDTGLVPITFWSDSKWGPQSRLRMVEASPWEDVARNYTADVQETLAGMMDGFDPGAAGQLILWQGPPGTGKTWALRALASEWRDWAEFHYITDPDAFFVQNPSYMIDVLLADSYEELAVIDGETEIVQSDRGGKWRILILEDTGELLAANAKESYGQGLSRLLNVVDGMVGQGLRVLCLVTTNDELGDLHPAVKRPGRCAVQLTFGPLSDEEAAEWAGEEIGAGTIAELYERLDRVELPEAARAETAFEEESEGMTAAGPAEWGQPLPDELVDTDEIVSQYRGKTDPIRQAVVRDVVGGTVEGVGVSFETTNPFVSAVSDRVGSQVSFIADTTRLNVNRIVRRSYEEGLSVGDTASAIRLGMAAAGVSRARMIARTELAALTSGGTLAAARIVRDATGIPYQKEWLTAPGAKHPRHEDYFFLDGQRRELDDLFDVGGAGLDYPGDPAGPADETVNCRCTLTIAEPEEGFLEGLDRGPPGEDVPELTVMTPEYGDTISVGQGAPVPEPMRRKILGLGLQSWPPRKSALATKVLGQATDTRGVHKRAGVWTAERKQLHDRIVAAHFEGKAAAPGQRRAYFTAGGSASGKSKAMKFRVGDDDLDVEQLGSRRDVVHVDPDRVKAMLPEYKRLRDQNDFYAANAVHEESSEIAKRIHAEAERRGLSLIIDTTGSSSSFLRKLDAAKDAGYDVRVSMVSIDTNEAIVRAMARGDRSGRYIAIEALKKAHAGASRNAAIWRDSRSVSSWRIYDNSGLKPRLVAEKVNGRTTVHDQAAFRRILAKADEQAGRQVAQGPAAMRPSELARNRVHSLDATSRKDIDDALAVLDRELDIPADPDWAVDVNVLGSVKSGGKEVEGLFDPTVRQIYLRRLSPDRYGTFLHEFGHYLDHVAGLGRFATASPSVTGLTGFTRAVRSSASYRQRQAALEASEDLAGNKLIKVAGEPFYRSHIEYMNDDRELFARAFVQWLARRDSRAMRDVRLHRSNVRGKASGWYWDDDEFAPIEAALDEFFRRYGWVPEGR